ncbi:MAG: hypothetical protein HY854_02780 [Burkholderiales bacterium]|nr:hypothetical protein [Burkholderiales bacterium]
MLACLAAAGACAQDVDNPPAETPDTTAAAPLQEPSSFFPIPAGPWLGPVPLGGTLTYDLRASRGRDEGASLSHLLTGSLHGRTYIFEPWFATLGGILRLSTATSRAGAIETGPFAPREAMTTTEQFITGNARLEVFPRSRFPFELHVEHNDSRVGTGLQSTVDFRTLNIGFSQRYRPVGNGWRLYGAYDHYSQVAGGQSQSQDVLTGEYAAHWKGNDLSVGLSASQARRSGGDSTMFQSLVTRHNYTPAPALSVDTTVNLTHTQDRLAGAPSDLAVLQWSSVGVYQPEGEKYSLTGTARAMMLREDVTGNSLESFGLTLGGTYNVSGNVRLSASGHTTLTRGDAGTAQSFSGAGGASWQGDSIEFAGIRWDPFASATLGASTASGSGVEETQTQLQAQAGHSLSRPIRLSDTSGLVLQMSQTLSATHIRTTAPPVPGALPPSQRALLHTASATWTASAGSASAYARIALSDSRELTGNRSHVQLANFQLSGSFEFDTRSSVTGDLTVQRTLQVTGASSLGLAAPGERSVSVGASGEITYRHQRLFGVPRLVFTSRLKLAQDVLRQPGSFLTVPERETALWENQLTWGMGRLEAQVLLRISQVEGRRREALVLRAQRSFGE